MDAVFFVLVERCRGGMTWVDGMGGWAASGCCGGYPIGAAHCQLGSWRAGPRCSPAQAVRLVRRQRAQGATLHYVSLNAQAASCMMTRGSRRLALVPHSKGASLNSNSRRVGVDEHASNAARDPRAPRRSACDGPHRSASRTMTVAPRAAVPVATRATVTPAP